MSLIERDRILNGERSTWPLLAFIQTRCRIELALDKGKYSSLKMIVMLTLNNPFKISRAGVEGHER